MIIFIAKPFIAAAGQYRPSARRHWPHRPRAAGSVDAKLLALLDGVMHPGKKACLVISSILMNYIPENRLESIPLSSHTVEVVVING
ncbi:MAG: hypothetical protein LUE17_16895, partial [Planctomycetaceae bacterium]|nr:hypothetical protein [Planctomycetaceae bacterium]